MEAYKGDTLTSIFKSMEILGQFPRQVIVLKGTQAICGLRGRRAGLQRRLIDERQTQEFDKFCRHLSLAKGGDPSFQKQIMNLGRDAMAHMDRILAHAAKLPDVFEELTKIYGDAELKILRTGAPYTKQMIEKHIQNILLLATHVFGDHPKVATLPNREEWPNTFIFRSALCVYLLFLRWISEGSPRNTKPERTRNDMVDMSFAAYGTFFDGLLTADNKLNSIFREADFLVRKIVAVSE